jgi:hypothetical protein
MLLEIANPADAYAAYLRSGGSIATVAALCDSLEHCGYSDRKVHRIRRLLASPDGVYGDSEGEVYVGALPPPPQLSSLLWFDRLELQFAARVLDSDPEVETWMSLDHVANWQFEGFLRVAKFRAHRGDPLLSARDFLVSSEARLRELLDPAVLYFEEASAYAQWFWKFLPNFDLLKEAQRTLPFDQFRSILFEDVGLWVHERGAMDPESTRVAARDGCLDKEPDSDKETAPERRIVFGEWERHSFIHTVTTFYRNSRCRVPVEAEFFDLLDLVRRNP